MKKICIMAVLWCSAQLAMAADWVQVSKSVSGDAVYVDNDSIQQVNKGNFSYKTGWTKFIPKSAQKMRNGKIYDERKDFYYADCHARRFQMGEATFYHKGEVVHSSKNKVFVLTSDDWDSPIPDSVGEAMYDALCKATTKNKHK